MNTQDNRIVDVIHEQTLICRETITDVLNGQARIAERRGTDVLSSLRQDAAAQARADVHELGAVDWKPGAPVVPILHAAACYRYQIGLINVDTLDLYVDALLDGFDVCKAISDCSAYVPSHAVVTAGTA